MTTSSPALQTASRVEIMASVDPQQTVISFSGSTVISLPNAHLTRDGVAQVFGTPGDGILIHVGCDCLLRGLFDLCGGGEVGKALRKIDRAMQHGLAGHFADDGFGEVVDFVAEKMLGSGFDSVRRAGRLASVFREWAFFVRLVDR